MLYSMTAYVENDIIWTVIVHVFWSHVAFLPSVAVHLYNPPPRFFIRGGGEGHVTTGTQALEVKLYLAIFCVVIFFGAPFTGEQLPDSVIVTGFKKGIEVQLDVPHWHPFVDVHAAGSSRNGGSEHGGPMSTGCITGVPVAAAKE